jgi:hypothetical protein
MNHLFPQWKELASAFERSCASTQLIERCYSIAGAPFRLRFAGPTLVDFLTSSLNHLTIPSAGNDSFNIHLFDSGTTSLFPTENIYYEDSESQIFFQSATNSVYCRVKEKEEAFFSTADAQQLPFYLKSYPLIPIFHWWLNDRGYQILHAASVGNNKGAVLLAGNDGAGKSTTALACLASSLQYLGDDRCLVALQPEPHVYSLYSSAKLNTDMMNRFPYILKPPESTNDNAFRFFLAKELPQKVAPDFPLRAVLLVRVIQDRNTQLRETTSSNALLTLAPSTLFQLPGRKEKSFQFISKLVKQLPCYLLETGSDLNQIPAVIESLLTRFD